MRALAAVTCVVALVACGPNTAGIGGTGGGKGQDGGATGGSGAGTGTGGGTGAGGGSGAGNQDGCPDSAKIVYVVDVNNTLSSFDPMTLMFHDIGTLNCPASMGAQPYSMAVTRDAYAYVLYDDGQIFRVSTGDAQCVPTSFQASAAFTQFGMGFSTDAPGGTTDTLFIAGGQSVGVGSATLGRLDTSSFQPSPLGGLDGWPELTGTGDAKLWAFFPGLNMATPYIAQLDKMNGQLGTKYEAGILGGTPNTWAFAFWGGWFWIFLKLDIDSSTNVWKMDSLNGTVVPALQNTGRSIVGAGVSTCAPITIN
jgi:hypothetical protein